MARANEELNFYLILINLYLNSNSHMCDPVLYRQFSTVERGPIVHTKYGRLALDRKDEY